MTNPTQLIEQLVAALKDAQRALQVPNVSCQRGVIAICHCRKCVIDYAEAALTAARAHLEQPTEPVQAAFDRLDKCEGKPDGSCNKCGGSCMWFGKATEPAPSTAGEREYIDRSAAVNLANNVIANDLTSEDLTTRGVHILADAVLRMDAALLQSTALPDHSEQHLDMVAALPVGELTLEQIAAGFRKKEEEWTFKGMTAWQIWHKACVWTAAQAAPARMPLEYKLLLEMSLKYADGDEDDIGFRDGFRAAEAHHGITQGGKA
jgi:hypothetical protein